MPTSDHPPSANEAASQNNNVLRLWAYGLLAYALVAGMAIDRLNHSFGDVLPSWHAEQASNSGSGYYKMRGELGYFQGILFVFGPGVYLTAFIGGMLFIYLTFASRCKSDKIALPICAAICLAILGRFFWLGVFTAGTGIGG